MRKKKRKESNNLNSKVKTVIKLRKRRLNIIFEYRKSKGIWHRQLTEQEYAEASKLCEVKLSVKLDEIIPKGLKKQAKELKKEKKERIKKKQIKQAIERKTNRQFKSDKKLVLKSEGYTGIDEYQHPLWILRRKQIKRRDGYKCIRCGNCNGEELQVHHLIYDYALHVWEYEDQFLITLCNTCHTKEHESKPNSYAKYGSLSKFDPTHKLTKKDRTKSPKLDPKKQELLKSLRVLTNNLKYVKKETKKAKLLIRLQEVKLQLATYEQNTSKEL
jgi:hypothetical protein